MSEVIERTQNAILPADAIVLYDWLMTLDVKAVPINHLPEKQALADRLSRWKKLLTSHFVQ